MSDAFLHRMPLYRFLQAIFAILALSSFVSATSFVEIYKVSDLPEGEPWVVRATFTDPTLLQDRAFGQMDIWASQYDDKTGQGYLDALVNRREVISLLRRGFDLFLNEEEHYKAIDQQQLTASMAEAGPLATKSVSATSFEKIPGYACYRTVEGTFATAESIVANYPDMATWIDAGDSWEKANGLGGYDIMVLKLTNSKITGTKPKLFANCAIHAREYATAEFCTRFAEHLVGGYGTDADLTWILDHHEVHLMLHTNPDGRKKAETGILWRKNTNQNHCGGGNDAGVDLNRNFDFYWRECSIFQRCSSGYECHATYRGPSAASEPELQALQGYAASIFPDQRAEKSNTDTKTPVSSTATGIAIDVHSYSELVLYPWGFTSEATPNDAAIVALGRKLAYFNGYNPQKGIELYPTDGTSDNYYYGRLGVATFIFELGTSFFQDCPTFEKKILPDNIKSFTYAAKVARTPYLTPSGPETINVSANPASVNQGETSTITATIDDTRYSTRNGVEPSQNIVSAEAFVDVAPWEAGATSFASGAPEDGSFNSPSEDVVFTIDTTGMAAGQHMIYIRGVDADNNVGAVSAVFLNVIASNPTKEPSSEPSASSFPSKNPTKVPSTSPSNQPSVSLFPSKSPTGSPIKPPTDQPSRQPTPPTQSPTKVPSLTPSRSPSKEPSTEPSQNPSSIPSQEPSKSPTKLPTQSPSLTPSISNSPVTSTPVSETVFFEDFETGWDGWDNSIFNDGGSDVRRYTGARTQRKQGSASLEIRDNSGASSAAETDDLLAAGASESQKSLLKGAETLTVSFWFYPFSFENNEDWFVEYTTSGSNWVVAAQFMRSQASGFNANSMRGFTNNVSQIVTVELKSRDDGSSPDLSSENSLFKFRFRCDASTNSDKVYIDNVQLDAIRKP